MEESPKTETSSVETKEAEVKAEGVGESVKEEKTERCVDAKQEAEKNAEEKEGAPSESEASEPVPTKTPGTSEVTKQEAPKEAAAKVIPKHHFTIIDTFLVICAVIFVVCAIGMTIPSVQLYAQYGGLILVFIFITGLFYATLHLQKV